MGTVTPADVERPATPQQPDPVKALAVEKEDGIYETQIFIGYDWLMKTIGDLTDLAFNDADSALTYLQSVVSETVVEHYKHSLAEQSRADRDKRDLFGLFDDALGIRGKYQRDPNGLTSQHKQQTDKTDKSKDN